jgi:hypothetical protein
MIVDAWRRSEDLGVAYPELKVKDIEAGKADPFESLTY